MTAWERLKDKLDWLARAKLVFDVAVAIGGGQSFRNLLLRTHQLPKEWISPPEWLGGACIFWLTARFLNLRFAPKGSEQTSTTNSMQDLFKSESEHSLPTSFNIDMFYRQAYVSVVSDETAKNMRYVAHQKSPNDVESFYLRFIGVGLVQAIYDDIWWRISKRQLDLFSSINRKAGVAPITMALVLYEEAVREYPKEHENRSFDVWLSYLSDTDLLLSHGNDILELTDRGKDFIKYLTHWGRESQDKRL